MKTKLYLWIGIFIIFSVSIQCQHDDEEIIPVKGPDPIEHGDEVILCPNCTPADFNTGGVPAAQWYFDKAHSNVTWETPYKMFGSLLTGRFNYFVLSNLSFYEATPASIVFEGYVRLNTVNTGEPGRDGGCLLGTYGTDATKTDEAENHATLVSIPNSGRYSSVDEGFLVDANLTFLGVTEEVTVKIYFFPVSDQGSYTMTGLNCEFEFNAISDFGLSSSNVDDKVVVKLNLLLKNKKA